MTAVPLWAFTAHLTVAYTRYPRLYFELTLGNADRASALQAVVGGRYRRSRGALLYWEGEQILQAYRDLGIPDRARKAVEDFLALKSGPGRKLDASDRHARALAATLAVEALEEERARACPVRYGPVRSAPVRLGGVRTAPVRDVPPPPLGDGSGRSGL